jgi:hypothetical protein
VLTACSLRFRHLRTHNLECISFYFTVLNYRFPIHSTVLKYWASSALLHTDCSSAAAAGLSATSRWPCVLHMQPGPHAACNLGHVLDATWVTCCMQPGSRAACNLGHMLHAIWVTCCMQSGSHAACNLGHMLHATWVTCWVTCSTGNLGHMLHRQPGSHAASNLGHVLHAVFSSVHCTARVTLPFGVQMVGFLLVTKRWVMVLSQPVDPMPCDSFAFAKTVNVAG